MALFVNYNLTLLALWVKDFYPTDHDGQKKGDLQFEMYSGITQTFALIVSPIIGIIIHKTRLTPMLYAIPSIGIVTFSLLTLIPTAKSHMVYPLTIGMGTLEVGYIIISQVLVARNAPKELRGSVIGLFSICGDLGLILASKLGGYLFDSWTIRAPFYLFILLNVLTIFFVTLVKLSERPAVKDDDPADLKACPMNNP
eukprot:CAMPEP_0114977174 /NCGR_PEP_ID=MMETSP0216-20121206/3085_1 /TAXON_ID=223996 /ORGANISM="Protocruzia adherens, Strain Boccale" /LENGTH=197 /DNA_ID=CAMNT_0002338191 /DNA_START=184 /DNA_END=777 /DNA_ORIENTATION=-